MNQLKSKTARKSKLRAPGGFALIVTLMLMILLTVIAVGMLSVSSIVIRSTSEENAMVVARSNARLALMIAIGDLQIAAGPDQRVTTTANIAAYVDGEMLSGGEAPENTINLDGTEKGLSSVLPGTRYWTGVFSNRDAANQIYSKTPAVKLERWLVSGIDASLSSQPTPADPRFQVNADGTVSDPDAAIVLVGRNTAGENQADRYVAAPRVIIPAASGGSMTSGGAFAYWVGDEGVKAKINQRQTNVSSDYSSLVAQRRAWETVNGLATYPRPSADDDLDKIISFDSLELLSPALGAGPLQSVFHSASVDSLGLLVNTQDGGTRVDLTALLSDPLPSGIPNGSYDNYPVSGGRVIAEAAVPGLPHLTWDHVRDFYQTATTPSNTLQVRPGTTTRMAIAPAIIDLRMLFGFHLKNHADAPDSTYGGGPRPQFRAQVDLGVKIALTLANPYSQPIQWNRMEFEILSNVDRDIQPIALRRRNQNGGAVNPNPVAWYFSRPVIGNRNGTEGSVLNKAIFELPSGTLAPGEARAYTIASRHVRPVVPGGQVSQRLSVPMAVATAGSLLDYKNWLAYPGTTQTFPQTQLLINSHRGSTSMEGTSPIIVELRQPGPGGAVLRRIENLEAGNSYRSALEIIIDKNIYFNRIIEPVPLLLLSYQISQPGTNYTSVMPSAPQHTKGQRGSSLRTYADFNLGATTIRKTIASHHAPPYFFGINNSPSSVPYRDVPGGITGSAFTSNLVNFPLLWGFSQIEGSEQTVLFSLPKTFVSLAQLQHADLTHDQSNRSIGHQPGNAFGNSYATPFVTRNATSQARFDYDIPASTQSIPRTYYDMSYLLNSAILDRYFFSTLPTTGSGNSLIPKNPGLIRRTAVTDGVLRSADSAAAGLMIEGVFNINSTEKEAWKAFLGSSKYFRHPNDPGNGAGPAEVAFPRSLEQPFGSRTPPRGDDNESFAGYRRLTDDQLDNLASAMVRQVRLRGPFVSLAHFVNRAIAPISNQPELSRSGALQTAIDESGVNISIDGSLNAFSEIDPNNDRVTLEISSGRPKADLNGNRTTTRPPVGTNDFAARSQEGNFGSVASILADRSMLVGSTGGLQREQGYRSTGIPGWVTQADVLQVIGPAVSARSDTFRIRTAGQSLDAAGKVRATAYAEAIVQRVPEYIDPADPVEKKSGLTQTNQIFGRKFVIISFRWLSPNEI